MYGGDAEPSAGGDLAQPGALPPAEAVAEGGGSVREEDVEEGVADGLDPERDLPPLHSILPLPRRVLHDPLRVVAAAAGEVRRVVVSGAAVGERVGGDRVDGALQAVEVLEGGGAAAEGAGGGACAGAVRAGAEDEGRELRSEQGAEQGEAVEELQRGDQVGTTHVVLSLQSHAAPRLLRWIGAAFLQIRALRLID